MIGDPPPTDAFGEPATSTAPPGRTASLPVPRTHLIGRHDEAAVIADLLRRDDVPLVTITGTAGVGKTTLALHVASGIAGAYPGGVSFVDLSPLRDPAEVLPAIARAVGLSDEGAQSAAEQLTGYFASRHSLLVLDNFEQVIAAAPHVANLLTRCPNLKILATSRTPLRLSLEHELPIAPLPISDAVQLFAQRAQRSVPSFTLANENSSTVEAICTRLDGLPLAIELAAARVAVLPTRALLARLDRALPLLTGGDRDRPDRLRTMRDAIAWSYDLLTVAEQTLFRRLAIFMGGFDLEAAEDLQRSLPIDDDTPESISDSLLDGITSLVEKNLLYQDSQPAVIEPRFRMLETVREFGLEKLTEAGELDPVQRAHAELFAKLAARAEPELTGANQLKWFERFEIEHPNLRDALTWAIAHDPALGLAIAGALIRFWDHHSHVQEGLRWLRAALAVSDNLLPAARAKALWGAGALADGAGDYDRAQRFQTEGFEQATLAGDHYLMGFTLGALGTVALHLGDLEQAATLHQEALVHARADGDADAIAAVLGGVGSVAFFRGDYALAMAASKESLAIYRSLKSVHGAASVLGHLGRILLELGDQEQALTVLTEGVVLGQRAGNTWYTIAALEGLAGAAAQRGAWICAAQLFGAIEAIAAASGNAVHPADRAVNERYLTAIRANLDEATFTASWQTGAERSLDQVIADALQIPALAGSAAPPTVAPDAAIVADLTAREMDVLRLLAQGLSDRDIAAALFLSPRTIGGHITNLLSKLELESRTAAAIFALRNGLD